MQLIVTNSSKNHYPISGVFMRGNNMLIWLQQLQVLEIPLDSITCYAIPGKTANSVYGCLVLCKPSENWKSKYYPSSAEIQAAASHIYLPAYSKLSPVLNQDTAQKVLKKPAFFHPEIGWFELNTPIVWGDQLIPGHDRNSSFERPPVGTPIPSLLRTVQMVAREEKELDKELSTREERRANSRLNPFEKIQLGLFKSFYRVGYNSSGNYDFKKTAFGNSLSRLFGSDNDKLEARIASLMDRNSRSADKLLSLLNKNPKLLERLAIPLDSLGASRGGRAGLFSLFSSSNTNNDDGNNIIARITKAALFIAFLVFLITRINTGSSGSTFIKAILFAVLVFAFIAIIMPYLGLGNRSNSGNSSAYIKDDRMDLLRKKYIEIINQEKNAGNYKKAAHLQIKLLKNYTAAAQILKEGEHYEEAAYIFAKRCGNKMSAAECYEKAQIFQKAIPLYSELNQHEKVGDLYHEINQAEQGDLAYQKAVAQHKNVNQYLEAATLQTSKLNDKEASQNTLLDGWLKKIQATQCLNKYFDQLDSSKTATEATSVYRKYVQKDNVRDFLKVMSEVKSKNPKHQEALMDLSYDIISSYHSSKPELTLQLQQLLPDNILVNKDARRFKRRK